MGRDGVEQRRLPWQARRIRERRFGETQSVATPLRPPLKPQRPHPVEDVGPADVTSGGSGEHRVEIRVRIHETRLEASRVLVWDDAWRGTKRLGSDTCRRDAMRRERRD